ALPIWTGRLPVHCSRQPVRPADRDRASRACRRVTDRRNPRAALRGGPLFSTTLTADERAREAALVGTLPFSASNLPRRLVRERRLAVRRADPDRRRVVADAPHRTVARDGDARADLDDAAYRAVRARRRRLR